MMTDGYHVPPNVAPSDRGSITAVASWTRTHKPQPDHKETAAKNEGLCSLKEWCLCGRGDSVFKNVKVTLVEAGGYGPPESIDGGRIWGIFLSFLNFLAN